MNEEFKKLAAHLYASFAAQKESDNWDWDPVASRACDAAESFTRVFTERYSPKAETNPHSSHLQPDVPSPTSKLAQPDVPSPAQ